MIFQNSFQMSCRMLFAAAVYIAGAVEAEVPVVPRLLAKYNFENLPAWVPEWGGGHNNQYRPATGWRGPFQVSLDTGNPHSGLHSLRMTLVDAAEGEKIVHSPAVDIPAFTGESTEADVLRIRLFVRSDGLAENGAGVRVLQRDAEGRSIGLLAGRDRLIEIPRFSPEWVELNAQARLHSRTASVLFMLVVTQTDPAATVWMDDISVELLPPGPGSGY